MDEEPDRNWVRLVATHCEGYVLLTTLVIWVIFWRVVTDYVGMAR